MTRIGKTEAKIGMFVCWVCLGISLFMPMSNSFKINQICGTITAFLYKIITLLEGNEMVTATLDMVYWILNNFNKLYLICF